MSENQSLKLRSIKCPTCGGSIEFETGRSKTSCPFCGGEVVIDEPGWLAALDQFDLKFKNAQTALENKEWGRALQFFDECIRIDDSDHRCWQGIIEAKTKGLNCNFRVHTEGNFRCFVKRAPQGESDPFVGRYKDYLEKVSEFDASGAMDDAKANIEYFNRVIKSENERIGETKGQIDKIQSQPELEAAEKKYGSSKTRLIVDTVLLFLAPALTVGFAVLFVYLVIKAVTGNPHIWGIVASVISAFIFAGVTKYVWKHYRHAVDSFRSRRNEKLGEDRRNDERAKHNQELINMHNDDIAQTSDRITELNAAVKDINDNYISVDRDKRVQMFYKLHLEEAGISNSVTVDPILTEFAQREKTYKSYSGYKMTTALNPNR